MCLDCSHTELCVEETGGSEEESAQVEEEADDEEGLDKEEEKVDVETRGYKALRSWQLSFYSAP